MTMYLSNEQIRPTGYEVAEFLDEPWVEDEVDATRDGEATLSEESESR
jgi:hypothetical protein